MFKVLLHPLTLSHMDANGLFGTTKVYVFKALQIYDTIKDVVHPMRPIAFTFTRRDKG